MISRTARRAAGRFFDSFAEELGRWCARGFALALLGLTYAEFLA
jgi:hypothetical protein